MDTKDIQKILDDQRKKSKLFKRSDASINRGLANNWKYKNENFSNTMKEVALERNLNDEYIFNRTIGIANRNNSYQAQSNARPEVQEKISKSLTGRKKSKDHLDKVITKNKERSKAIQTPWGQFTSRREAIDEGLKKGIVNPNGKIDGGLKSKPDEYYYLDK